jgi:hypothetical protein
MEQPMPDDETPDDAALAAHHIKEGQRALAFAIAAEDQALSFIDQRAEELLRLSEVGPSNAEDMRLMMTACKFAVMFQKLARSKIKVTEGIEELRGRL